jgi:hypothetical protein
MDRQRWFFSIYHSVSQAILFAVALTYLESEFVTLAHGRYIFFLFWAESRRCTFLLVQTMSRWVKPVVFHHFLIIGT